MRKSWDGYKYYLDHGCNYFSEFIMKHPEFCDDDFLLFVDRNNKGDRDSGETQDLAKHEVLRLAYEYEEYRWRNPHIYDERMKNETA